MGGQWSEEWGGDNWNYGAEVETGYLRSLARWRWRLRSPSTSRTGTSPSTIALSSQSASSLLSRPGNRRTQKGKWSSPGRVIATAERICLRRALSRVSPTFAQLGDRPRALWLRRMTQPVSPRLCLQLGAEHFKQLAEVENFPRSESGIATR